MIAQIRTLLRVKELKYDQALRAMQAKRNQFEAAVAATARASAAVEESTASYAAREDAIYAEIIGHVIDQADVDETHGRMVQLEKDHASLVDALERAKHVQARIQGELDAATAAYFQAMKIRDKFSLITDDMKQALVAEAESKEENEIEELFAMPREKVA